METAWIYGLIGGLLIGTASALHLLLNGRIAGLTAIIRAAATTASDETARLSSGFLLGAFGGAYAVAALWFVPEMTVTTSVPALLVSGLLVGLGTSMANGCTSGHGIIGMARLSPRSIAATLTFMAFTALTVWVLRHGIGVAL